MAGQQILNMKIKGLYTHDNPLSEVPEGALVEAQNAVIDAAGIIETRPGIKQYGDELSLGADEFINNLFSYKGRLLVSYADKLAYDSNGSGTWVDYSGTYEPPTGAIKIHSVEANKNFYFTTSGGVMKLDTLTATPTIAGMYKALDGEGALTGASGFLATANQVAYRIVWGIRDANNNLILGAPSQRIVVINDSGGSRDVNLTFTIPAGITTSYFYQVYRSLPSGGAAVPPNDELGLIIEDSPTSLEVAALEVAVTDNVPDALRGATLYTSPSQQGITQANDEPPIATDVTYFKNSVLYANTTSKQRITVTLISVGSPNGIQVNDTITIGGVVYTGKATEAPSAGEFDVVTSGTLAENIEATALSLVRVINQYASNTEYYAYYTSGFNDLPGRILIEERSIGGTSYALISSRGGAFNPVLPTSGTTVSTTNENSPNRVYVAKQQQPGAVPILNYLDVGSADQEILRVVALRDSAFVLKEDGIFRITGNEFSNFQVSLMDNTVILIAPETASPYSNQIFAYTSQGVVAVSDTGVAIMSRQIEQTLLQIQTLANFNTLSFGVPYESRRKFIVAMPDSVIDEVPTQEYVYNGIANEWTQWLITANCGLVNPEDDRLYLGSGSRIYQERKSFTVADYADDEFDVTIVSSSGSTVELVSTADLEVGFTLKQESFESLITEVTDATHIEVADDDIDWDAGAAIVYKPIEVLIQTAPQTAGNPGILKQFREITAFFRRANFDELNIGFRSNLSVAVEDVPLEPLSEAPWGLFPWGEAPWGGGNPEVQTIRTYIPRNKQRANWIDVRIEHINALNVFAVAGLSIMYHPMSERFR